MTKIRTMYQATDKYLKKLKTRIRNEFNHLSVLSFDELNIIGVKKETTEMFKRLIDFNAKEYQKIAKEAHEYACTLLTDEQQKKESKQAFSEKDFVTLVLLEYNSVTGYLYENEAERKRLRLSEEMLTAREFQDRNRYSTALNRGANLWYTQSGQYAIDIEDSTVLEIFRIAGVEKVRWVAENDSRTCKKCKELDGQIFNIDQVPPKQHYHCRCYVIPHNG